MSESVNQTADRFSLGWPAAWFCVGFAGTLAVIVVSIVRAFREFDELLIVAFILMPLLAFAILVTGIVWFVVACTYVWSRRSRRLVSALAAPTFILITPVAYHASGIDPRFLIERGRFDRVVAALPEPSGTRYKEFHWVETGLAGSGNTSSFIVYDETDRLPRRIAEGATRWPASMTFVKPMGQHYFFISERLN